MATADTKENTVDNRESTNDNRTSNARDFIDQVPNHSQTGSADNCFIRIDSEAGNGAQPISSKDLRIGNHALHNRYQTAFTAPQRDAAANLFSHSGPHSEQLLKMTSQLEGERPFVSDFTFNLQTKPEVQQHRVESPKIIRQKTKTQKQIAEKDRMFRTSMLSGEAAAQGVTNEERYDPNIFLEILRM